MDLYETDYKILENFIGTIKLEDDIINKYLILYNFATDCKYSKDIQPDLILYLLPFYIKIINEYFSSKSEISEQVYGEFNSVILLNKYSLKNSIGNLNFNFLMDFYINLVIKKMETCKIGTFNWLSIFNIVISFDSNNIVVLFEKILLSSIQVKYLFFEYISFLLFYEKDNILIKNIEELYWKNILFESYDTFLCDDIHWCNLTITYFNEKINESRIIKIFNEIYSLICKEFGEELAMLIKEEVINSLNEGIFIERKKEYLLKISNPKRNSPYSNWLKKDL